MKKLTEYCLSGLMLLGLWLYGRLRTYSLKMSRGVQVLVPAPKDVRIQNAMLSPNGKNLIYKASNGRYLMLDLVTRKTHRITKKCEAPIWLDHQTLFCKKQIVLLDVRDFSRIPLQKVDAQQQSYSTLLEEVEKIYELKAKSKNKPVYLILSAQSHVYLFNVEEQLKFPKRTPLTVIPRAIKRKVDHVSPNGQYYYKFSLHGKLRIFKKKDNRIVRVRETAFKVNNLNIVGWMYDSSGLIFYAKKEILDFRSQPIYKLNVPRS